MLTPVVSSSVGLALLGFVLLLVAALIAVLVYSGLFQRVDVGAGRPPIGKVVIAYKFARGPYKDVGPLFSKVSKIAPNNKCLGIYYDDPQKVEAHKLRHVVASIVAEDMQKVDQELMARFEAEGFHIMELPKVDNCVRAAFPFRTMLSVLLAVRRVYPLLHEYIKKRRLCAHPYLEVYEGKTMHFMVPLSRQADFYVPESLKPCKDKELEESLCVEDSSQDISLYSDESTQDVSRSMNSDDSVYSVSQTNVSLSAGDSTLDESQDSQGSVEEGEDHKDERGAGDLATRRQESDKESGSSFEDLKFETEEIHSGPLRHL